MWYFIQSYANSVSFVLSYTYVNIRRRKHLTLVEKSKPLDALSKPRSGTSVTILGKEGRVSFDKVYYQRN